MNKDMKRSIIKKTVERTLTVLAVTALAIIAFASVKAQAAAVRVTKVDYDRSEMTVALNSGDTALLISDSKAKKWETMAEKQDGTDEVTFDISWISQTVDYVMTLKGDASADVVKITIPKQNKSFKVSYFVLDSEIQLTNSDGRTAEWRKKESMSWTTYNADSFAKELEGFCANGAVLFFRLAQTPGAGSNAGLRPSKEVSVTIPKKTAAPSVKINDNSLTVTLNKGIQYRYLVSETGNPVIDPKTGTYMDWEDIDASTDYDLQDLAPLSMYTETNNDPKETFIQFRTKATASKQMSNITTLTVPAQQAPLTESDMLEGATVEFKYTSSTTFQLKVKSASTSEPYQYCIIDEKSFGTTDISSLDMTEVTWKDITSASPVKFDKTKDKIEEGTKIYVRKKALHAQGDPEYRLASPYINVSGNDGINYPGEATVATESGSILWLQTVAGVCNTSNTDGSLEFTMYSPTETTIKSIKFVDYDNLDEIGSVEITSSVAKNNENGVEPEKKYIITTKIRSTANIDSNTRSRMLAYITYESGSTFKSTKEAGLGLYIFPATKVENPGNSSEKTRVSKLFDAGYTAESDHIDFSTAFRRVYLSNKVYGVNGYTYSTEDKRDFKFIVKLGTVYKQQTGRISGSPDLAGDSGEDYTQITKLKYDNVELGNDCYSVEYATDRKNDGTDVRLALVTVHCDKVELIRDIDDRNKDTNLVIVLNNGEILSNSVTINFVKTATVDKSPVSWSLTPANLETEKTVTTTSPNGTVTTTTEKVYDYIIEMTLFDPTYSVAISEVTWNG
ncbi:MAG: hypothetical protein ILP10_01570, partial [Lachnospiraceae bacterium]|nr:hypothetical protein [Lachnospiraceae bacterium]